MDYTIPEVYMLDQMSYADLEATKIRLETLRQRILLLQNAQSTIFQLPGEIRNRILYFAMKGELLERRKNGKHSNFKEPAFFRASRQIYQECSSVWHSDVVVWEELVDGSQHIDSLSEHRDDQVMTHSGSTSHIENLRTTQIDCMGSTKIWKRLAVGEVKAICCERSRVGKLTLVTQPAHCDIGRTRENVELSRSICPRKGLVRMKGFDVGMSSVRWWMW